MSTDLAGLRDVAEAAWLAYRDDYQRTHNATGRRAARQMRKRDFIAGFMAAGDRAEAAEAAVERLRALADEWESWSHGRSTPRIDAFRDAADDIRTELGGGA